MLPFGPAPAPVSTSMGASEPGIIRVFRRYPVTIAVGMITAFVGLTWFMSSRGERLYRQRVSGEVRTDPQIRWNPKVKRWQDARGKFVKPPPGAAGGPGTRRRPVRLLI